jgi:hypothetical protein
MHMHRVLSLVCGLNSCSNYRSLDSCPRFQNPKLTYDLEVWMGLAVWVENAKCLDSSSKLLDWFGCRVWDGFSPESKRFGWKIQEFETKKR